MNMVQEQEFWRLHKLFQEKKIPITVFWSRYGFREKTLKFVKL